MITASLLQCCINLRAARAASRRVVMGYFPGKPAARGIQKFLSA